MPVHHLATTNVGLRQQAEQSLSQWIEPCLGCDLLGAGAVRDLHSTARTRICVSMLTASCSANCLWTCAPSRVATMACR